MGLDYSYTCPDIDRSIKEMKSDLESHLIDMLDEVCPLFDGEKRDVFLSNYVDNIYSDLENNFEAVRKVNEDMRKEADLQLENAEEEVSNYKDKISDLENKISDLEEQISDL